VKINEMVSKAHEAARSKGWWDQYGELFGDQYNLSPDEIAAKLCLIHSEVSEALEAVRGDAMDLYEENGKPEGLPAELADVLIRIGDLCGALGIDLEEAVSAKMAYNLTRTHRHGGKAL
jgi:NTP pyrophosphatase (non-canonical NTP hydrolase)